MTKPKCLLPILDKSLIERVIESFPKSVNEVFLTLSGAYEFPERVLTEKFPGKSIEVVKEEEALGTGGPIKALEDRIKGDFLVLNGDVLSSIDLSKFIRFHKKKKSLATISLFSVENPKPYGVVEIGKSGKLIRFEEKPEKPFSNLINAGTYVLSTDILEYIPKLKPTSIEREVFTRIAKDMYGFAFEGHWIDCGTFESFLAANRLLLADQGTFTDGELENMDVKGNVFINQCRIRGGTFGPDVVIGKESVVNNTTISNSVIFKRAFIDSYSNIENSILGDDCRIGKNCYIRGCILGDGIEIEGGSRMINKRLPHGI